MSECEYYQELISRMLDKDLNRREKNAVMEHLDSCEECAAMYRAFRMLSDDVSEKMIEPPEDLTEDIMSNIRRREMIKKNMKTSRQIKNIIAAAACVAVLIAVAGGIAIVKNNRSKNAVYDARLSKANVTVDSGTAAVAADGRTVAAVEGTAPTAQPQPVRTQPPIQFGQTVHSSSATASQPQTVLPEFPATPAPTAAPYQGYNPYQQQYPNQQQYANPQQYPNQYPNQYAAQPQSPQVPGNNFTVVVQPTPQPQPVQTPYYYVVPTAQPVPTQEPQYVVPTQIPQYVEPTQAPQYVEPTQAPQYFTPVQEPQYVEPTQEPQYFESVQEPQNTAVPEIPQDQYYAEVTDPSAGVPELPTVEDTDVDTGEQENVPVYQEPSYSEIPQDVPVTETQILDNTPIIPDEEYEKDAIKLTVPVYDNEGNDITVYRNFTTFDTYAFINEIMTFDENSADSAPETYTPESESVALPELDMGLDESMSAEMFSGEYQETSEFAAEFSGEAVVSREWDYALPDAAEMPDRVEVIGYKDMDKVRLVEIRIYGDDVYVLFNDENGDPVCALADYNSEKYQSLLEDFANINAFCL